MALSYSPSNTKDLFTAILKYTHFLHTVSVAPCWNSITFLVND